MPFIHESEVEGAVGSGGPGHSLQQIIAPWTVGSERLWVGLATIQPGVSTKPSGLEGIESAHVTLEGIGREIVAGETIETRPGTFVWIPEGAVHQVINVGDEPLKVLTMATPPIQPPV